MKIVLCIALFLWTSMGAYSDCLEDPCLSPPTAKEERLLFLEINAESHRLYNSLDCEGKKRAIELSKAYANKDCAVQEAAIEMGQRRAKLYKSYREQRIPRDANYSDDPYGY